MTTKTVLVSLFHINFIPFLSVPIVILTLLFVVVVTVLYKNNAASTKNSNKDATNTRTLTPQTLSVGQNFIIVSCNLFTATVYHCTQLVCSCFKIKRRKLQQLFSENEMHQCNYKYYCIIDKVNNNNEEKYSDSDNNLKNNKDNINSVDEREINKNNLIIKAKYIYIGFYKRINDNNFYYHSHSFNANSDIHNKYYHEYSQKQQQHRRHKQLFLLFATHNGTDNNYHYYNYNKHQLISNFPFYNIIYTNSTSDLLLFQHFLYNNPINILLSQQSIKLPGTIRPALCATSQMKV